MQIGSNWVIRGSHIGIDRNVDGGRRRRRGSIHERHDAWGDSSGWYVHADAAIGCSAGAATAAIRRGVDQAEHLTRSVLSVRHRGPVHGDQFSVESADPERVSPAALAVAWSSRLA